LNLGSMLDVLVDFEREYSPGLSPRHFAAIERGGTGLGVVGVVRAWSLESRRRFLGRKWRECRIQERDNKECGW
jgi:hypothetical protein